MEYLKRIAQLRRRMRQVPVPGFLVTHLPDVRYLSGFTGSNAALAVSRRGVALFTDGRYTTQAKAEVQAAQIEIVSGSPAVAALLWLAAENGMESAGFETAHTTVAELGRLRIALPARLRKKFLVELDASLVEPLRMIKDEEELARMREAALIGCQLFDKILGFLRPGLHEFEVAAELEYQARRAGAEGMSFETIVASGMRSALPHGRATEARLPRKGFVTMDFGIIHKGYCSDMTRTVFLGPPSQMERETYQAVLEAQQAGVEAVASGVRCGTVDEAARGLLRSRGLAEVFSHATGHGVGLEIHEPPRVGARQAARLKAGMVITIEPGVYLAGKFGIRIEDTVAVTATGCEVLTPAPKALIEL
jgi:Xaa-Pro aminopeptidase